MTVDGGAQVVWGKDMRSVIFVSPADGFLTLYRKNIGETESPTVLYRSRNAMFPTDLSPDGRYLALHMNHSSTQMDLVLLPLDAATGQVTGEPVAVRHSRFLERLGYFAPDGKHIAYTSDESGLSEVYVEEGPAGRKNRRGEALESKFRRWRTASGGGGISRSCTTFPRSKRDASGGEEHPCRVGVLYAAAADEHPGKL